MSDASRESTGSLPTGAGRAMSDTVLTALYIALVGAVIVGGAECVIVTAKVLRRYDGHSLLPRLIVAAFGKCLVTHALVWCPVLAVLAIARAVCQRFRPRGTGAPFLVAAFVSLSATVVIPADLQLGGFGTAISFTAAGIISVFGGGVAYYIVGRFVIRCEAPRLRRTIRLAAIAASLITMFCGWVMVRSPLGNPASFRVPASTSASLSMNQPNVLWIVLDTVRPDRMSCYGYTETTTPFLDELAKEGLIFDRAVANGIWTLPSHASMFTGLSVREHGTDFHNLWLDETRLTIAELLQRAGYRTAAFTNNPWIAPHTNMVQGFDSVEIVHQLRGLGRFSIEYVLERHGITPVLPWLDRDHGAALTNDLVFEWLNVAFAQDEPVFLFVNYMEAHLPYRVPRRYRQMYMPKEQVDRSYDLRWSVHGDITTALSLRFNVEDSNFFSRSDREVMKRLYLAAIRQLDDRVRELVEMFKHRGQLDNTLVIISSDHGEYLDTHGIWGHRYQTYDDVSHVSLIIRQPESDANRIRHPVQLSDIYGTIAQSVLGVKTVPDAKHGTNLLAAIGKETARRIAVTEYNGPRPTEISTGSIAGASAGEHRDAPQVALQDGRFKYIASANGTEELYDLSDDPGELNDLIDQQLDVAQELRMAHRQWIMSVPQHRSALLSAVPIISPETLEALRSLGYIDGEDE